LLTLLLQAVVDRLSSSIKPSSRLVTDFALPALI
jgi:hypothetical protein